MKTYFGQRVAVRQVDGADGLDVGSAFCGGALSFRIDPTAPSGAN